MLTRKLNRSVIIVSLFLFVFASACPGQSIADDWAVDEQKQAAAKARDLILLRRYDDAETFLKSIVEEHPDGLLGYFGLMSLCQIRNVDNFDFRFDPAYLKWEDQGRDRALDLARNPAEASAWDLLVAGGTLGISGFYRAHNHRWFAALRDSSLGFHTVQKSYAKDKTLTDALLGVGLYDYWRSHFTRKLHFLPFFDDRRAEGKAELQEAAKQATFTDVLAEIGLAFIDYQEKSYDRAASEADRLIERYPGNTILRMLKGECLVMKKKYPEAVAEFEKILALDPKITKSYLYMGIALAKEGKDKARAKELLEKYLKLETKASDEWRRPAIDHLKSLDKPADSDTNDRTPDASDTVVP